MKSNAGDHQGPPNIHPTSLAPNEFCRPNAARDVSRPVGTRGGVGWMRGPCAQYISLKDKRGKKKTRKLRSGTLPESLTTRSFLMYRLRQLDLDDKVCDQVDMTLLAQVYPKEAIERCVGQSQPWASKARRVRQTTLLALVLFVIGMALWSRLNQRLVWDKLVGKLSALHPGEPQSQLNASALSGRRQELGSQGLQALMHECCQVLAQPQTMPSAFFGRYRLIAIDGTVFNTADTQANEAAFGRSSNQYGKGAYPQVRCVLLAECGSHAVVELEISRYDGSEVHGAHRLLDELGRDTLVLVDAGIISGGFLEHACGSTCLANGAWPMARYWSGCPPPAQARRTIRCSVACGCASFPIG